MVKTSKREHETFSRVFVKFCFAIPSESAIVSAGELVWKAMELFQLDEDRMLRAKPSFSRSAEVATGRREQEKAEFLIPAGKYSVRSESKSSCRFVPSTIVFCT